MLAIPQIPCVRQKAGSNLMLYLVHTFLPELGDGECIFILVCLWSIFLLIVLMPNHNFSIMLQLSTFFRIFYHKMLTKSTWWNRDMLYFTARIKWPKFSDITITCYTINLIRGVIFPQVMSGQLQKNGTLSHSYAVYSWIMKWSGLFC